MVKKIAGFSLDNILQIFSLEKKSQTLRVRKEEREGLLDIDQGELIHAELGPLVGVTAAIETLIWDDVQIEILPLRPCQRTITKALINILLEVSKLKDERANAFDASGEGLLAAAIDKAEQQQYKEAHADLVQYLKKKGDSVVGWIWYSRIHGNVGTMKKALARAAGINGQDALVREEQDKFSAAIPHLTEDVAKKCYFCWTPLNRNATTCHYCGGDLIILAETLARSKPVSACYLEQARERYTRVLKKNPRSLMAIYCLGLINVNSHNYQEALGFLDKATKIAPGKAIFVSQLTLLLDHLASHKSAHEGRTAAGALPAMAPVLVDPVKSAQKMILVVEDSSTTRKVIAITLSRKGYRVVEAADGLEALSRISEERPDLIMLDVILPKMDGYKILSIIKGNKEFKEIPVIMLTSKDGFINKMKGKMAGSSAYLTKPFDPDKMIAEIEKHLQ